ncbi:MAG TPA: redox-sensitive transcriptional activator SoxR [Mycobacteriales bacterium]|jgi:MerR family redox-sensitive transcriptional activator SoxR
MPALPHHLTIGELAARSGVRPSALRFYEQAGLVSAERTAGNQRRYARSTLRRVAFIRAAQRVGLTLEEIRTALATLPADRTPTRADWRRLSRSWQSELEARITTLQRLRDQLTSCIGCGCLSLRTCSLSNTDDVLAARGAGVTALLPDRA